MEDTKSIFASKAFWGSVIAGLSGLAGIFGVEVSGVEQETLINGVSAVGLAVGTALAIFGRMRAGKKIG